MPGSLTKDLPYWDIYRDMVVLSDGRLVPILKLELPQSDLKSSEDLTRCNDLIAQTLRYGVPENEVLSLAIHTPRNKLDITKAYEPQRTTHEVIAKAITEDRIKHFKALQTSRQLFQHEMYVSS
jgi:type IV secretory pathway VirB4 component